jgi:GTPase Era involved in 16S rRNA processing
MIEILMADDHAIFRSGVRRLLSDEPDMRIVAEAANGQEALDFLRQRTFGLVLLDVNMCGRSGLDTLRRIHAAVVVNKPAHKGIVIGKAGERLKRVSTDARKDMERLFGGKVWLETWVKVKSGWSDDERALKSLGYE